MKEISFILFSSLYKYLLKSLSKEGLNKSKKSSFKWNIREHDSFYFLLWMMSWGGNQITDSHINSRAYHLDLHNEESISNYNQQKHVKWRKKRIRLISGITREAEQNRTDKLVNLRSINAKIKFTKLGEDENTIHPILSGLKVIRSSVRLFFRCSIIDAMCGCFNSISTVQQKRNYHK